MKRQRFCCLICFAQNRDLHLNGKTVKLHDWPQKGSQLLVQWATSYFLPYQDCHLFQQQFVFNIEINGSVKLFQKIGIVIRSSHDPKWQACMRETDADRSWQAGHRKPWTSIRFFSDEMCKEDPTQGIPDWLRTFLWKRDLRSGRWCFKSGDTKMEAQHSYSLPQIPNRSIPRTEEIGDLTTVERKSESRNNNQQFAAVVQDLTTQWILLVWNQNFTGDGE